MTQRYFIFGAGGHGRVVFDTLTTNDIKPDQIVFIDEKVSGEFCGCPILNGVPPFAENDHVIVAIGNNAIRKRVVDNLIAANVRLLTLICRSAYVSPSAILEPGVVVCSQAHVGPNCHLWHGVIANSGSVIDHDCEIGAYTHIAPHATLCGSVRVGESCMIGAAATLLPGASVGDNCTVGAMSLVLQNGEVKDKTTIVGVPAARVLNA